MQAEAVNYTVYTLNRIETSEEKGVTPIELWLKKRPNISNLRIFGEEVEEYFYITKKKRRKWDVKAEKGIFVGYDENTKGFRIWLSEREQVKIHRNVRFTDKHYEFNSNEEQESDSNTIIFEHQKNDTTKINESKTVIQSENNEQINLDEESDDSENQYEQDRHLRDRNKIR